MENKQAFIVFTKENDKFVKNVYELPNNTTLRRYVREEFELERDIEFKVELEQIKALNIISRRVLKDKSDLNFIERMLPEGLFILNEIDTERNYYFSEVEDIEKITQKILENSEIDSIYFWHC